MCFIWRSVIATAGIPSSTRTTTSAGRSPRTANGSSFTRTARLTDAGPLRGSSPGGGEVVDAQGRGIDAGVEFEVGGGPILTAEGGPTLSRVPYRRENMGKKAESGLKTDGLIVEK